MDDSVGRRGAGVGVGSGSDGAGVAVIVAVGTGDTHAVVASLLSGGNFKGGSEDSGVGAGALTDVDDFVAVEGAVVVPVDPDDGTIGVAGGIGDVKDSVFASGNSTDLVAVVAIVGRRGRTLAVVDDFRAIAEGDIGDTAIVNRVGSGLAVFFVGFDNDTVDGYAIAIIVVDVERLGRSRRTGVQSVRLVS